MNNSVLSGVNVMPLKGQTSSNGGQFSLMRSLFRDVPKQHPNNVTDHLGKNTLYQDNSLYLLKKKANALGKQAYNSPLSFNGNPKNDAKQAKKRVRSSGSVAPPKKGFVSS
tara:strand:+ start:710 stop:1042 length:333 start_codon:yes stop_codon:yes gene_type:complete